MQTQISLSHFFEVYLSNLNVNLVTIIFISSFAILILLLFLIRNFRLNKEVRSLRNEKILLLQSQEVAKIGHWEWNNKTKVDVWSQQIYTILERFNKIHIIDAIRECICEEHSEAFEDAIVKLYKEGDTEVNFCIKLSYKQRKHLHFEAKAVLAENETVQSMYGVVQDVTKNKNFQDKLLQESQALKIKTEQLDERNKIITQIVKETEKAKQKAEISDKLKSAFLANISHEIRTPMNGILGFAQLLLRNYEGSNQNKKYLYTILQSSKNLLAVLNSIIDFSIIESGDIDIRKTECNIHDLIQNVYNNLKDQADRKQIDFDITENSIVSAVTDKKKLTQILFNLTENAIKFTKSGKVTIGFKNNFNNLHFFVSDTGMGIPFEEKDVIFNMFVQGERAIKYAAAGTGLGLTIAKAYVDKMKGKLWFESEVNKGTTFFFELPLNVNELVVHKDLTASFSKNINHVFGNHKLKLLIAEDEDINFKYLQSIFDSEDHKIFRARNGKEAIDLFRKHQDEINIVLLDLKMPEKDGFEAAEAIRKLNSQVPIIAQTAYAFENDSQKALNAGCDACITKPIKIETLLQTIDSFVVE